VNPDFVGELLYTNSFEEESRRTSEVLRWIDSLTTQLWLNRHKGRECRVKKGKTKIVTREEWDQATNRSTHDMILEDIWKGAIKADRTAEKEIGSDNIGPYDDFEWGMLSGNLSALRCDEWDNLDT
jgi:hypothetical protein